ncbi:glycosyltransferase [Streptomyces diastatochromogenes]|nr:glycosyltransferase [Streptomyces diastatochromogenes]
MLAGAVFARRVTLVHAFLTVGRGFPLFSRLRPLLLGGRPVVHTVAGVPDPRHLTHARPLGVTVALSESMARRLRAAGFGDVRVVPPMISPDEWPYLPRPRGLPTVLFAGHHDPAGGAEIAIDAAAEAHREGQVPAGARRARTAGAGRRGTGRGVAGTGGAAGLTDFEVRGHVEDMRALLASVQVLLFPPAVLDSSDIPLTVLRALASGRPAILSDLPQFADFGHAVLRAPRATRAAPGSSWRGCSTSRGPGTCSPSGDGSWSRTTSAPNASRPGTRRSTGSCCRPEARGFRRRPAARP